MRKKMMISDLIDSELKIQWASNIEDLKKLAELTQRLSKNSKAKNTLDSYASDWEDFQTWCKQKGLHPLPAASYVVTAYLSDRATNE